MYLDVVELHKFYAQPIGTVARRLIGARIRRRWKDVSGQIVFGTGYAVPYLRPYLNEAARSGALMPAPQGVIAWPADGPSRTALVEEALYPLCDASVDRLLAVHCLEMCENVSNVLREIWRVLSAEGRALIVVPNRRSAWARADTTPFGHGRPFSRSQFDRLLKDAQFSPLDWGYALYMPPSTWPIVLRSATAWERVGARLWPAFAGILLVEVRKEVYSGLTVAPEPAAIRLRPVPVGA